MLMALVLSPRLRRAIGWIGLFGLAIGAVWIVFAAGLGGGQNAGAPGLVFLVVGRLPAGMIDVGRRIDETVDDIGDRKSTRLNSSH